MMSTCPANLVHFRVNQDTYVFIFDDRHAADVMCTLGRFAADERLNLSWYLAAQASQLVREMVAERRAAK